MCTGLQADEGEAGLRSDEAPRTAMDADRLAMLRDLVTASEARWRAMEPHEAARYVYSLRRLRMALAAAAASEAGNGCGNTRVAE